MAPDDARLEEIRRECESLSQQKFALDERELTLRKKLNVLEAQMTSNGSKDEVSAEIVAPVGDGAGLTEESVSAKLGLDRFAQSLAFRASRVPCFHEEVIKKYSLLPVTFYCGFDPISKEIEETLTRLLEGSCRVNFRVRHFCAQDPCGMEDVMQEHVALMCFFCSGKEQEADTIYGRDLRKKLHYRGKGWSSAVGCVPDACSVFGYGAYDPFVMLYRNSRGDSGLVAEALEALGSVELLRHEYVDENVVGGVSAVARQWAYRLAQKVEDWARGCWEPEPETMKGPEWTFEEVMRWDFVHNRRGMQDG